MKTTKIFRFSLLLVTLLLTTAANAQIEIVRIWYDGKITLIKAYTPATAPKQGNSLFISKINKDFKEFYSFDVFANEKRGWHGRFSYTTLGAKAFEEKIEFTKFSDDLYYKDIIADKKIQIREEHFKKNNGKDGQHWGIIFPVSGYKYEGEEQLKIKFLFSSSEAAQDFAENMYFILQPYREKQLALTRADSIQFSIAAAKYRELAEKPAVTEEQRKYIVQANMFNEEKNYAKTIELYKKTIEINPVAYPAAYYNLALMYAQENDFRQAIFYMKKYLILVPDAPDARAAQDKIYEWEAKIQ